MARKPAKPAAPSARPFVVGAVLALVVLIGSTLYVTWRNSTQRPPDKIVITDMKPPVQRNLKLYPFNFDLKQSVNGLSFAAAIAALNQEIEAVHGVRIEFAFAVDAIASETVYCKKTLCWDVLEYLEYFLTMTLNREVKLVAGNDPVHVGFE